MTDRELLKEARDLIVMCSLIDKSGQCEAMTDKIDKQLSIANVVGQSERLPCELCSGSGFIHDDYIGTGICSYCNE